MEAPFPCSPFKSAERDPTDREPLFSLLELLQSFFSTSMLYKRKADFWRRLFLTVDSCSCLIGRTQ